MKRAKLPDVRNETQRVLLERSRMQARWRSFLKALTKNRPEAVRPPSKQNTRVQDVVKQTKMHSRVPPVPLPSGPRAARRLAARRLFLTGPLHKRQDRSHLHLQCSDRVLHFRDLCSHNVDLCPSRKVPSEEPSERSPSQKTARPPCEFGNRTQTSTTALPTPTFRGRELPPTPPTTRPLVAHLMHWTSEQISGRPHLRRRPSDNFANLQHSLLQLGESCHLLCSCRRHTQSRNQPRRRFFLGLSLGSNGRLQHSPVTKRKNMSLLCDLYQLQCLKLNLNCCSAELNLAVVESNPRPRWSRYKANVRTQRSDALHLTCCAPPSLAKALCRWSSQAMFDLCFCLSR
jgi:hypothetical protein